LLKFPIVYNGEDELQQTIDSVINQSYKNIEYIIIDSNSNDGTSNIISKFKKKLTYIREKDKNIYEGLNKGIKKAKGRYIGLLHSGDEFKHNFSLSDALKKIKDYKLDAASFSLIYQNKKTIKRYWKAPKKKITKIRYMKKTRLMELANVAVTEGSDTSWIKDSQVRSKVDMVIKTLNNLYGPDETVDGETLQFIIEELGMDYQMLKQLSNQSHLTSRK